MDPKKYARQSFSGERRAKGRKQSKLPSLLIITDITNRRTQFHNSKQKTEWNHQYSSAWGLSTTHISPHTTQITATSPLLPARVIMWDGGNLAKVQRERYCVKQQKGGGKRGSIRSFSKASRMRLMRTVARVKKAKLPIFVTLTYPSNYSDSFSAWKRDLDVFTKRVKRKYPRAGVLWRLDFQMRGAPHYHLLLWGVPCVREWISRAWYEVVGSGDLKHLQAGTNTPQIRSYKHLSSYVSKRIARVTRENHIHVGRWWGILCRKDVPWAEWLSRKRCSMPCISLLVMPQAMSRGIIWSWTVGGQSGEQSRQSNDG